MGVVTSTYADRIQVSNESAEALYVAPYYYKNHAEQSAAPQLIAPHSTLSLERPARKAASFLNFYDRELIAAFASAPLAERLSEKEFQNLSHQNIGDVNGSHFYLSFNDGLIRIYTWAEWQVERPILEAAQKLKQKAAQAAAQAQKTAQKTAQSFKKSAQEAVATVQKTATEAFATVKTTTEHAITSVRDTTEKMAQRIKEYGRANVNAVLEANPYKTTVAQVRRGNELSPLERAYIKGRLPKVKVALEHLLGESLDNKYIPKIAVVGSGGGIRALLCTTGYLVGAQQEGLLDACTWSVGLSGSTWALALWTSYGLPIEQFREKIVTKLHKPLQDISASELQLLMQRLLLKHILDQPLTLVDIYGGLLANRLLDDFGDGRHNVCMSQQSERINDGNWLMPLYTAVRTNRHDGSIMWFEFSPYEIGCVDLEMYVPTWSYNRVFANGVSTNFAPEQSLGFHLGTFGSAFAAPYTKIFGSLERKISASNALQQAASESILHHIAREPLESFGKKRVKWSWAEVTNIAAGIQTSPLKDVAYLRLVDAGLDFNLPYPPVSGQRPERKADIIIFLDASKSVTQGAQLRKVQNYAQSHGLKFPPIDYTAIDTRTISVFKDENDLDTPVIIYMPRITDQKLWNANKDRTEFTRYAKALTDFDVEHCMKAHCSTFNFTYTADQARQLTYVTEFNMKVNKNEILNAIRWVIARKSPQTTQEAGKTAHA